MNLRVQSVNFTADQSLINFIQDKLDKLGHFHSQIIDGEVFLKVDNNHSKQNKITEVKLLIPGHELVVKKQARSFEQATDQTAEVLKRQLRKHKEKLRAMAS
ncbi:MAG: ribosome-associated translation inhibitor RaiA [Owenweeksia sp.]|nr:ribosome-associated translation inhibitor RaiA [Owenweeksia sp.]